jgi:hypothetical protein
MADFRDVPARVQREGHDEALFARLPTDFEPVAVDKSVHEQISAIYSTKSRAKGGLVVREWLRTQSYETQRAFGLNILRQFGVIQ